MKIVLRGSDAVKRSHIMRCLETSGLKTSRTRHDGLQAAQVTQGGIIVKVTTCDEHHEATCNNMGKSG
jgi:hypothetical protein